MGKIDPKLLSLLVGAGAVVAPETSEAGFGSNAWKRVQELLKYAKDKSPEQVEKAIKQIYKESNENTLDSLGFLDMNDLATKARINRHEIIGGLRAAEDPAFRELIVSPYSKDVETEIMNIFQKELSSNPETKNIILNPVNNKQLLEQFKNKISKSSRLSRQDKVRILNDLDSLESVYKSDKDGSGLFYSPDGKRGDPQLLKLDPKDIKTSNETANLAAALEGTRFHEVEGHAKEFPFKYSPEETAHRNLNKATSKNNRVLEMLGLKKAETAFDDYSAPRAMDILDQAQDYSHFDRLKDIPNNIETLEQHAIRKELDKYRQGKKIAAIAPLGGMAGFNPTENKLDSKNAEKYIENLDELYKDSMLTKQPPGPKYMDISRSLKDTGSAIKAAKDLTYGPILDNIKEFLAAGDNPSDIKNRIKDSAVELALDPMNLVNMPLGLGLGAIEGLSNENEYQEQKKRWKNILGSITTGRPHNSVIDDIKE